MLRTSGRWLAVVTSAGVIGSGLFVAPAATAAAPPAAAASAAVADFPATATFSLVIAARRPAKVTVPARYVYKPKLGARHDFCTGAPDEFPAPRAVNADFRGPCARHDLCYDGRASKKTCDKALRRNLFRNCAHYYGRWNPLRTACKGAAVVYWAAVVAT